MGAPLWWMIGVPIAVIGAALFCPAALEPRVRWAGLVLQLAGLSTVAWGLRETRKRFGKPSFLTELWAARPRWRRDINIVVGAGNINLEGARVDAVGTVGFPPDATLEQKVAAIQSNLENLHNAFHANRRRVEDEFEKH